MTIRIALILLAIWPLYGAAALADVNVTLRNGRTLRADECELVNGIYRITTMAGGLLQLPHELVSSVMPCATDKKVVVPRGKVPPGAPAMIPTMPSRFFEEERGFSPDEDPEQEELFSSDPDVEPDDGDATFDAGAERRQRKPPIIRGGRGTKSSPDSQGQPDPLKKTDDW